MLFKLAGNLIVSELPVLVFDDHDQDLEVISPHPRVIKAISPHHVCGEQPLTDLCKENFI